MSTYEALFDLHQELTRKLKKVTIAAEEIRAGADLILELVERRGVDLGGVYLQRLTVGKRRLGIACKQANDSINDDAGALSALEDLRIRRDVAFAMDRQTVVQRVEVDIEALLEKTQYGIQQSFEILELIEKVILGMALPRLVVG